MMRFLLENVDVPATGLPHGDVNRQN